MNSQRGNIFFIILLGVVLFAALAFIISRSMRSETTSAMSRRSAELMASDILEYGQRLERGISKLRQQGVSENDIDFTTAMEPAYDHTPSQPDNHKIFIREGGGVSYKNPAPRANDGSAWIFTGGTCVKDVGSGGAGCDSDSTDNEELLAVLPNLNQSVCEELNKRLGVTGIPTGGTLSVAKFTGTFVEGDIPSGVDGKPAACIKIGANYMFYTALLAR